MAGSVISVLGVAAVESSDLPRFTFLHSLLPHGPLLYKPDGSFYANVPHRESLDDPYIIRFLRQRHLLQLGFVDRLLGEYLDRLEAVGDFDRAIVVVTADHGMSFVAGEDSFRSLSRSGLAATAGVPLFYKESAQKTGTLQHQPVELVDIAPTIVADLGLEPRWEFDGRNILAADLPAVDRSIIGLNGEVVEVPEGLAALTGMEAARTHEVFGDGVSGSLYALGGARELIGTRAAEWETVPSTHCWTAEQPAEAPEEASGFVFGRIESSDGHPVTFAFSFAGVIAGTARSFREGSVHRVYAVGDSRFWHRSEPVVELYDVVGGRLAPIPLCRQSR